MQTFYSYTILIYEMSQENKETIGVTLAWEQKYDVKEINTLMLLCENDLGKKIIKDLDTVIGGIEVAIAGYTDRLSNTNANLAGYVEKIAALRESKKLLARFKTGFFDPEMLHAKYNEAFRLQSTDQQQPGVGHEPDLQH